MEIQVELPRLKKKAVLRDGQFWIEDASFNSLSDLMENGWMLTGGAKDAEVTYSYGHFVIKQWQLRDIFNKEGRGFTSNARKNIQQIVDYITEENKKADVAIKKQEEEADKLDPVEVLELVDELSDLMKRLCRIRSKKSAKKCRDKVNELKDMFNRNFEDDESKSQ